MFEFLKIKFFGIQPTAKITDKTIERIIKREFGNNADKVKDKLQQVISDTSKGRNRISAAVLKLANKDFDKIDYWIHISNNDFREVVAKAEYPRISNLDFAEVNQTESKNIYSADWLDYSSWINKS